MGETGEAIFRTFAKTLHPMFRIGIILIAFGILYLVKPTIYKRGIWKQTDQTQRRLSPAQYIRYMRMLGGVFLVVGIVLAIVYRP